MTVNDQDPYSQGPQDSDPEETGEWAESLQQLVDAKGNLTVKTDAVRQALEYYKKLISFLPPDVNQGTYRFEPVSNTCVRYGLGAIKGSGEQAIVKELTDIQYGRREDTHGWLVRLDG